MDKNAQITNYSHINTVINIINTIILQKQQKNSNPRHTQNLLRSRNKFVISLGKKGKGSSRANVIRVNAHREIFSKSD